MQHLPLDPIIIPNALDGGIDGLPSLQIQPYDVAFGLFLLQRDDSILHIEPAIDRERLRDDEHGVGIGLDAKFRAPLGRLLRLRAQVIGDGDFERPCTRDEAVVLQCVLDRPQAIADCVVDLTNGVRIWTCSIHL